MQKDWKMLDNEIYDRNIRLEQLENINQNMYGENQNLRMNNANMHGEIQNLRMNNVNIDQERDEKIAAMGCDMGKVLH